MKPVNTPVFRPMDMTVKQQSDAMFKAYLAQSAPLFLRYEADKAVEQVNITGIATKRCVFPRYVGAMMQDDYFDRDAVIFVEKSCELGKLIMTDFAQRVAQASSIAKIVRIQPNDYHTGINYPRPWEASWLTPNV